MKTKYNQNNFHNNTCGVFTKCKPPFRVSDFTSESGSKYWFANGGVIRLSTHWGKISSCLWTLDPERENTKKEACGFCSFSDFTENLEVELDPDMFLGLDRPYVGQIINTTNGATKEKSKVRITYSDEYFIFGTKLKLAKKFTYKGIEIGIYKNWEELYTNSNRKYFSTKILAPNNGVIPVKIQAKQSLKSIIQKTIEFLDYLEKEGNNVKNELTRTI